MPQRLHLIIIIANKKGKYFLTKFKIPNFWNFFAKTCLVHHFFDRVTKFTGQNVQNWDGTGMDKPLTL
jgi:hypothetical protein